MHFIMEDEEFSTSNISYFYHQEKCWSKFMPQGGFNWVEKLSFKPDSVGSVTCCKDTGEVKFLYLDPFRNCPQTHWTLQEVCYFMMNPEVKQTPGLISSGAQFLASFYQSHRLLPSVLAPSCSWFTQYFEEVRNPYKDGGCLSFYLVGHLCLLLDWNCFRWPLCSDWLGPAWLLLELGMGFLPGEESMSWSCCWEC